MLLSLLFLVFFAQQSISLIPPMFQWKVIDFAWQKNETRDAAIGSGDFIPENNMPTGIARWKDKLFITIPRLKKGVPSSLNYVHVNGAQGQPLNPYPSWEEAYIPQSANSLPMNSSVVCAFRAHVDSCNRLWTVDNGVTDITDDVKQITEPALVVFDLETDQLLFRYVLDADVLKESSVLTSIAVDIPEKGKKKSCHDTYAYITDMGSNAIIVFSLKDNDAWRIENPYFFFDPQAGMYKVGGIEFYWSDGVSSATLSNANSQGYRDLYFHPTSSTKQFKISTRLLRNKTAPEEDIFNGVQVIGDKGPLSQTTACDYDSQNNVLFYTQLSKNGVGCWNTGSPFNEDNTPVILSDCTLMEFPSDIKVDQEHNVWMLSNRQSRFLYGVMKFDEVNFRVLSASTSDLLRGSPCEKTSAICKAFSFITRPKSSTSKGSKGSKKNSW